NEKDSLVADLTVCQANGAAESKNALLLMKAGRLPEDFVEGMCCEGGCVGGPSSFNDQMMTKKVRESQLAQADGRGIHDNIDKCHMEMFSMHRE
ncbi:MAG: ferredoxin, partial [Clostridiales bacterium]|nr:ferredoxin [Clostridiales bacterium]